MAKKQKLPAELLKNNLDLIMRWYAEGRISFETAVKLFVLNPEWRRA